MLASYWNCRDWFGNPHSFSIRKASTLLFIQSCSAFGAYGIPCIHFHQIAVEMVYWRNPSKNKTEGAEQSGELVKQLLILIYRIKVGLELHRQALFQQRPETFERLKLKALSVNFDDVRQRDFSRRI